MAKKKKKLRIELDRDVMDKKKALRIPTAKGNQVFKAKKGKHVKYDRTKKHKKNYEESKLIDKYLK